MKLTLSLPAFMLVAGLAACTGAAHNTVAQQNSDWPPKASPAADSPFGSPDKTLPVPDGDEPNPMLSNGQAVLRALDALEKRSGKPLRVTSMVAVSGVGLTLDVQEPNHRENVDEWMVKPSGEITGPTPVHVDLIGSTSRVTAADIDRNAFDPRKIPFARLNKAEHEALTKAKLTDGRLSEWAFDLQSYMISMESPREKAYADVSPQLTIERVSY